MPWFLAIVVLGGAPLQAWPDTGFPDRATCELAASSAEARLVEADAALIVVTHCYQEARP